MGTLHCALENRANLYVNERQKIRPARSTDSMIGTVFTLSIHGEKKKYFSHGLRIIIESVDSISRDERNFH